MDGDSLKGRDAFESYGEEDAGAEAEATLPCWPGLTPNLLGTGGALGVLELRGDPTPPSGGDGGCAPWMDGWIPARVRALEVGVGVGGRKEPVVGEWSSRGSDSDAGAAWCTVDKIR